MPDDFLDEFLEIDSTMGSGVVKCPHYGAEISRILFIDDEMGSLRDVA
ncbi:MAG: hypothetical protein ABH836_02660 [Candidatus Omnitrophota bacterium]